MTSLRKILSLYARNGYLNVVSNSSDTLSLGPCGSLLQENLKQEWIHSNVINRDMNVFLHTTQNGLETTYNKALHFCENKFPFGIAEIVANNANNSHNLKLNSNEDKNEFNFQPDDFILRCTMFVLPEFSTQLFHQWQRQRNIWWRKFSALPSRYSLTDIQHTVPNNQRVEITATYPWGTVTVETVTETSIAPAHVPTQCLTVLKDAHVITSETNLQAMLFNTLCDAYDDPLFRDQPREIVRLHRKLAPFKINFVNIIREAAAKDEMQQLLIYLRGLARKQLIPALSLPSNNIEYPLTQEVWCESDQMGIPYSIILEERTLKTGVCGLRSRDTTLTEDVHISNLITYVQQLLKNY